MRESQKGSGNFDQWHSPRSERPPTSPVYGRAERPAPSVNTEAQRARMEERIHGILSSIQQEQIAVARMKREGLSWQAEQKEATIKALQSQITRLKTEINQLAA